MYADEGDNGTLRAHMARANPHWRDLQGAAECLVVFLGPQGYITPSWYATKQETQKVVPTWNYVTVHAWGKPRLVEEAAWLRRQLDDLTRAQESARPGPWAVGDAPEDYVAAQMQAIVGIEIPIDRIEGKWKTEPEPHGGGSDGRGRRIERPTRPWSQPGHGGTHGGRGDSD